MHGDVLGLVLLSRESYKHDARHIGHVLRPVKRRARRAVLRMSAEAPSERRSSRAFCSYAARSPSQLMRKTARAARRAAASIAQGASVLSCVSLLRMCSPLIKGENVTLMCLFSYTLHSVSRMVKSLIRSCSIPLVTFTFRAFSRRFYPKRLSTIHTD